MAIREHTAAHDSIQELPLISDSATVSLVERLDTDRREKARETIHRWVREHDLSPKFHTLAETPENWPSLQTDLTALGHVELARRIATLAARYHRPKPMLVRVRVKPDDDVSFLPGQYVGFRYNKTSRAYSLSSSPDRPYLEFCVRRVPGGRLSPTICDNLNPGDTVSVRGPYGELVLQDSSTRDMAFLATGTGVAPFKSMIDYVFENGLDEHNGERRNVWLFLGAAWEDDLPYRTEFNELATTHDNFHYVPTLSREPILTEWEKETDYVQHAFLKHVDQSRVTVPLDHGLRRWITRTPRSGVSSLIDPNALDVYACGINAMVYSLVHSVESIGVPADRIESEGYG